jgi:pSer/pThr/pTyr-binding forkhead associated (FHA) protein
MFLIVNDPEGQRVYRLSPQGPDQPVLVGSGADCAVVIPYERIAVHHCGIFTSGEHWFIKDQGSENGTFVNGVQARFSTPIIEGDTITLGDYAGAPTLILSETKPATGISREAPADDVMPLPEESPELNQPYNPGITTALTSGAVIGTPLDQPRRRMSPEAILAGALVMLAILAIGLFLVYRLYVSKEHAVAVANAPPPAATTNATPIKVIVIPASRPVTTRAAPTEPPDPHAGDEDWKAVDEAHRLASPALAIVAYDYYVAHHPDTEFKSELERYTEEALDHLWWERIKSLMDQQANLQKQIKANPSDDLKKQLADVEDELFVQMKYTLPDKPDPFNTKQIDQLRASRDAGAYAKWKQRVLTSIRNTRGSLPW